jgi:D-3-phosphoglycerate dehydrogenase
MLRKVYFIDTVHEVLAERLTKFGFQCVDATNVPLDEMISYVKDAFGLVIRSKFTLNEENITQLTELQFVARSGSGLENIDVNYCASKGIQLFNSPEGNRNAVAEQALGMLLSLLNKIPKANAEIRNGVWDREGNRGEELDGKTIGIIGFGHNGGAFARKLHGFEVKVMAYDRYKQGFGDHFVQECTLEAIQEQADIISFHIPQNEETIHFLNESFIQNCSKPFYLLNLSRGRIVQTSALVKALKEGKIKGACLDVLEYEKTSFESFFDGELPEDFSYLMRATNVLLSPHVGGWTKESYFKLSNVLADKIIDFYSV